MQSTETKTCDYCGRVYARNPKWSRAHFEARTKCSRNCPGIVRPDVRTDYVITETGCWEWQGHIDANGYGKAYDESRPVGRRLDWAHRVSYRVHRGPIPDGHELDHTCENPPCINPDHLDPVTKTEHAARTFARAGKDERHRLAATLRQSGLTYKEIADALGTTGRSSAQGMVQAAVRKGLVDAESVPPVPRLSEQDYEDIRALCAMGIPQTEVAAWYKVDSSAVSRISRGMTNGRAA